METKQGFSFMRKHMAAKTFALLQDELKHILTLFIIFAVIIEVYSLINVKTDAGSVPVILGSALIFSLLYSALYFLFLLFAGKIISAAAAGFPALLLSMFLINSIPDAFSHTDIYISYGIIAGSVYMVWLILHLTEEVFYVEMALCLISDIFMIYVYFNGCGILNDSYAGKAVYVILFILSISCIKRTYPFVFFLALMICILLIPVRKDPINWDPVIDTGKKVISKTREIASSVSYWVSDLSEGSSYLSGYSSFTGSGEAVTLSGRTEIELRTRDNTVITYSDEETGSKIKRRRTVYLTGGQEVDPTGFLDVLFSFYLHDVDYARATLFSRISAMEVSYVYLKTNDEILPEYTLKASNTDGKVYAGTSDKRHKKGYSLKSEYLDLDLGSPYLAEIIATPMNHIKRSDVSYKKMSSYAFDTMGLRLADMVSEDDFKKWQTETASYPEYLDTGGADDRMYELAREITKGAGSDYEKCRAIEAYLRQYKYNTNVSGTKGGDTLKASGMKLLADDFLFERGEGYCIHFSSSMVMLLRLNGIPARLVSGYRYVFPFDKSDSYEVAANCAHAWPEAYIDGFGWVGFEPTSAMSSAQERTWHRHPALSDGKAYGAYVNGQDIYKKNESMTPYPTPVLTAEEIDEVIREDNIIRLKEAVRLGLIIVMAAVFMAMVIILTGLLIKVLRYKRASSNRKLIMDVKDIKTILGGLSSGIPDDRGVLSDYGPYIPEEFRQEVKEVFSVYYRILYRCGRDDESLETVNRDEEIMARELRKKMRSEFIRKKIPAFDTLVSSWHN